MNKAQSGQVMAILAAAYRAELTAEQAQVWMDSALGRCSFELGMKVAGRIVAEDRRFPTPARFNEVARAVREEERPPAIEEDYEPVSPERARWWIARIRQQLAASNPPPGSVGDTLRREWRR